MMHTDRVCPPGGDWISGGSDKNNSSYPSNGSGSTDAGSDALHSFSSWFQGIHGYVSIVMCLFGIASNFTNIVVLTRKNMITPTNHLLTALATADALTMISYLPYATYFYCLATPDEDYGHSQYWVLYLLFNIYFTITTHTIAMWLTVSLAVFRYIVVCHHTVGARLCSLRRAKLTIIAVFLVTPIVCIPNYIIYRLVDKECGHGYWFQQNGFVTPFYTLFNFWLFAVVLKVAPCVLLTVLSTLLLCAMKAADERRRRLKSMGRKDESEKASENFRTTAMLVAVVLCFVVAELPQGILAFLSGIYESVFREVYVPLGDVWDLLGLLNSAVNFVLYCTMSKQFRKTFGSVFLGHCKRKSKQRFKPISANTAS